MWFVLLGLKKPLFLLGEGDIFVPDIDGGVDVDLQLFGLNVLILITTWVEFRELRLTRWRVIHNFLMSCRVVTGSVRVETIFSIFEVHLDLPLDGGIYCYVVRLLN